MKIALFIGVITILHLLGYALLVYWTTHLRAGGDAKAGEIIGHVWDGDLQEKNNPLPGWWLSLFYLMIVVGAGYLVLYPGVFGDKYAGTLGWSQLRQYEQEKADLDSQSEAYFAAFADRSVEELSRDPAAVASGQRLFLQNCAVCHGSNGQGAALGYPNLTDGDWIWGGDGKTLLTTIAKGRNTKKGQGMPAGGALINPAKPAADDEEKLTAVAHYVHSFSHDDADPALAEKGKALYNRSCVGCHGKEGQGVPAAGGIRLNDDIWLYSEDGAVADLKRQIRSPANNVMPAWEKWLSENRIKAVAAYVYSLSHEPD